MRGVLAVVLVVAGSWLAVVVLAAAFQRQLIYLPDAARPQPPGHVEEVALTTADGLELTAWYLPHDDPVATVLVLPGNAGNRSLRMPLAEGLHARGHAVLLLDYRGYGANPGSPSEQGLLADATAAHDHLTSREDVDEDSIAYLGESIGTGVASALAAERPPAGLVLRSPFPALADVAANVYPFLPVRTLLRDEFAVGEHLVGYEGEILVVAGDADRIVPTRLSRDVAEEAGARLVLVPGAGHNDFALLAGDGYLDAVDEHLRRAVSRTR